MVQPVTSPPEPDADHAVERLPCQLTARAWWAGQVVAETTGAVRVEEPDQAPVLYFPPGDVRLDLFRDAGRTTACPVKGTARLWSAGADGGQDVAWSFVDPAPGLDWLSGLVGFDHDRVQVELVDGADGQAPREATVKRFPTWGDAAQLVDLLDVRSDGEGRYMGGDRADWRRPVVEGSHMLAQAIVAAGRHAPGRRAVSAHMVFMRPADARHPVNFDLEELTAGRTFTALAVHAGQGGRRCATGTLLLDVTAPDVIRHGARPPDVPGPYDTEPYDMGVTGRDVRIVDGAYTDDPDAPVGPPVLDAWVRFREVPDEPYLHAGLLAQFTGHLSIAAALRPHPGIGQAAAHRTLSTAVNAITLSLHREVRADRWMLYHHHSTFAGDGMTHSACRVHDEDGELLASFSVESMVRGFPGGATAADSRTAM